MLFLFLMAVCQSINMDDDDDEEEEEDMTQSTYSN